MQTLPLVTIIIPAYNHERFIQLALDSTLNSGLVEVELIVCDDGSSDSTPDIVSGWAAINAHQFTRFVFTRHEKNLGLSVTMNELIAAAQGEIICSIGSDDIFLPGALHRINTVMLDHPEWHGAFFDGQAISPEGAIYRDSMLKASSFDVMRLSSDDIAEELFYYWQEPANLIAWRKAAFLVHGGEFEYDSTVFCEDLDFAIWALGKRAFGLIQEVCYGYRCRSWPQTSTRNYTRELRDISFVFLKHARHFPSDLAQRMRNRALGLTYTAAGEHELAHPFHVAFELEKAQCHVKA